MTKEMSLPEMQQSNKTLKQIAEEKGVSIATVKRRLKVEREMRLHSLSGDTSSLPQRKRVNARQAIEAIYKVATQGCSNRRDYIHGRRTHSARHIRCTYGGKYIRTQGAFDNAEMAEANNTEARFVPQWMKECAKGCHVYPSEAFNSMLEYAHSLHEHIDEVVMDFLRDNKLSIANYKSGSAALVRPPRH